MKKKKDRITRFTVAELRKEHAAGRTHSDWARAATVPLPDGSDPDDAMEDVDMRFATTTIPLPPRKKKMALRLDAEVLDYFRKQGKGYQTRINAVLKAYVNQVTGQPPRER